MRSAAAASLLLALSPIAAGRAAGQEAPPNYVELRLARSENGFYRYAEYSRVFPNALALDLLYLGNPGQNELFVGLGRQIKATATLTLTPLLYGVVGKENGERGVALGLLAVGSLGRWSVYSFAGYFEPVAGTVSSYLFVDSLDLAWKLGRWELGGSAGLFRTSDFHSYLVGPVLVRNDRRGAWRLSLRGGSTFEARLARTVGF